MGFEFALPDPFFDRRAAVLQAVVEEEDQPVGVFDWHFVSELLAFLNADQEAVHFMPTFNPKTSNSVPYCRLQCVINP